jgi:hypothetical protein
VNVPGGLPSDLHPPTCASLIAGIIGAYHHACIVV